MTKQKDNEVNIKQARARSIRETYFVACSFHDRFVAGCGRCVAETEKVLADG